MSSLRSAAIRPVLICGGQVGNLPITMAGWPCPGSASPIMQERKEKTRQGPEEPEGCGFARNTAAKAWHPGKEHGTPARAWHPAMVLSDAMDTNPPSFMVPPPFGGPPSVNHFLLGPSHDSVPHRRDTCSSHSCADGSKPRRGRRGPSLSHPRKAHCRPRVERLEERTLPASRLQSTSP